MSNVLIGIIGVILFIGLALAGALILGDDFRSASNSSKAAALASQMKQMVDAAEMRKLKLGVALTPSTDASFLVPRFLKSMPVSPTSQAAAEPNNYLYQLAFNNNVYPDGFREPQFGAKYVVTAIGPTNDGRATGICQALAEMSPGGVVTNGTDNPPGDLGCTEAVGYWMAYQRLEPVQMSGSLPTGL
jgi:hypothetical protein